MGYNKLINKDNFNKNELIKWKDKYIKVLFKLINTDCDEIILDVNKNKSIKIPRKYKNDYDIYELRIKYPLLKIEFGNGSVNNDYRGKGGFNYEHIVNNEINRNNPIYCNKLSVILKNKPKFIAYFNRSSNTRRPIKYDSKNDKIYVSNSIGNIIADIFIVPNKSRILDIYNTKPIPISIKKGELVTFMNIGIKKILKSEEIKKYKIENKIGIKLLNILQVDIDDFIDVFTTYNINEKIPFNNKQLNISDKLIKEKLFNFIKTCIGKDYILIHKINKNNIKIIHINDILPQLMPISGYIEYGPLDNKKDLSLNKNSKRVNIIINTKILQLKFNFRNKQSGVYPTHLMADFIWL